MHPHELKLLGGTAVRTEAWPDWPISSPHVIDRLESVAKSGRWAISGPYVPAALQEREFSTRFANYCGTRYCVPTANGSSALVIALEALDIGPGDEVLVPSLTWVATASAVLRVGATPVFIDVNESTLCMDERLAEESISKYTKAILLVHLHQTMADIDSFLSISAKFDVPIIEDAAQAHGATWRGKRAGSFGLLGSFSFQQTKALTCGEGGAVVTDEEALFIRLQQLRADSRIWTDTPRSDGMQLIKHGSVMGANYCMSEFHAAILNASLDDLDSQLREKEKNALLLDALLSEVDGVTTFEIAEEIQLRSIYKYVFRLDLREFGGCDLRVLGQALTEELGLPISSIDPPLQNNALFRPNTKRRFSGIREFTHDYKVAEAASSECLALPHQAFLGDPHDMEDIAAAVRKVKNRSPLLASRPVTEDEVA